MFDEKTRKIIGKYLKEVRKAAGFSQKQVSVHFGYTTPQFISNWERGLMLPPLTTMRRLLIFCNSDSKFLRELLKAEYGALLNDTFRKTA